MNIIMIDDTEAKVQQPAIKSTAHADLSQLRRQLQRSCSRDRVLHRADTTLPHLCRH